jgi:hypothetical protein
MLNYTRQLDKIFIGFKNATDCIDSYRIQHDTVDIGAAMQNRAQIESFLYNQMKGESEKKNKHASYSLHEEVMRADESHCGVYLTYAQLAEQLSANNNRVHAHFPVTSGSDMLLPLQGFNLFPNGIFDDLTLIIKVIPNALVWACTDPKLYIEKASLNTYSTTAPNVQWICRKAYNQILTGDVFDYYDYRFTQVRVQGLARSNLTVTNGADDVYSSYFSAPLRIDPDTCVTREAVSTILGFSLKDTVKAALAEYYTSTPSVIPSEGIYIQAFSTGPTESGLNCAMNIPLNNAKEVIAVFPHNANEMTVFRNPEYNHLMLTLLNRNFPQKGANSTFADFYRIELESCNLDTILCPTQSFESSYVKKVCPTVPFRQRSTSDDTGFALVFNLERQSSNAFFADPVNSANETVMLTGSPQVQGSAGDVYYWLNTESDIGLDYKNQASPIVAVVSDTFWMILNVLASTFLKYCND